MDFEAIKCGPQNSHFQVLNLGSKTQNQLLFRGLSITSALSGNSRKSALSPRNISFGTSETMHTDVHKLFREKEIFGVPKCPALLKNNISNKEN